MLHVVMLGRMRVHYAPRLIDSLRVAQFAESRASFAPRQDQNCQRDQRHALPALTHEYTVG